MEILQGLQGDIGIAVAVPLVLWFIGLWRRSYNKYNR